MKEERAMKFADMPYRRPDPEQILRSVRDLTERFQSARAER